MIESLLKHVNASYPELDLNLEYTGDYTSVLNGDSRDWTIRCQNQLINAWIWHETGHKSKTLVYWHDFTSLRLGSTESKEPRFVSHLIHGNFAHWLKKLQTWLDDYSCHRDDLWREGKELILGDCGRFHINEIITTEEGA